jgi:hypothetical protein
VLFDSSFSAIPSWQQFFRSELGMYGTSFFLSFLFFYTLFNYKASSWHAALTQVRETHGGGTFACIRVITRIPHSNASTQKISTRARARPPTALAAQKEFMFNLFVCSLTQAHIKTQLA